MMMGKARLFAAAALLALAGCGGSDQAGQEPAALPAGEKIRLELATIPDLKTVGAEVTTADQAVALARIPGTLVEISVREGDMVAKGQRIATISDARIGFEAGAYDAQAAAAEAEAVRARAELGRVRELHEHGVYSKARLEQATASAKAASAQADAARAQKNAGAAMVGQGAVLAPASGRVLRADVPAGAVVMPGMAIATITAGAPVLRLDLPETLAGRINKGAAVTIAKGELGEAAMIAKVSMVYPQISMGRFRVDATAPGLLADFVGRRVSAAIAVGTRKALVVPKRFVSTRYGIDQVELVARDGRLSSVPVQIAPTADPAKVEILSGVAAGDTLFAAGDAK